MIINPLLLEIEIEKKLKSFGLPVRIRRNPSEYANAPTNKIELWVRYVDSQYEIIPNSSFVAEKISVTHNRTMLFHVMTEVISLQNHERALTIHNNAIGLLTGWRPKIKINPEETTCKGGFADIIKPFYPIRDRFEKYAEGKYQYRIDFTVVVPHSNIMAINILPFDDDWSYNDDYNDTTDEEDPVITKINTGFYRNQIDEIGSSKNKDIDFFIDIDS